MVPLHLAGVSDQGPNGEPGCRFSRVVSLSATSGGPDRAGAARATKPMFTMDKIDTAALRAACRGCGPTRHRAGFHGKRITMRWEVRKTMGNHGP